MTGGYPGRLLVGLILLAAGLLGGWALHGFLAPTSGGGDESPAEEEGAPVDPAAMEVAVTVAAVERGDLPVQLRLLGRVEASADALVEVTSRAGGRVAATFVVPGQEVAEGAELLRFDRAPLEAALAASQGELAQATMQLQLYERSGRAREKADLEAAAAGAQSDLDLATGEATRLEALARQGLSSPKALAEATQARDRAARDLKLAREALQRFDASEDALREAALVAARDTAEAAMKDVQAQLDAVVVRAPRAGTVLSFPPVQGRALDPGSPLATLLCGPGRRVTLEAPVTEAHRIRAGAAVTWDVPVVGRGRGRVLWLAPQVDSATGLVNVEVRPDEDAPVLLPGRMLRAAVQVDHLSGALLVPEAAVVRHEDEQVVVRLDADDHAHLVPVHVLGQDEGKTAVEGALEAGDRVVLQGAYNLPEGAHVVVEEPQAGGGGR
jgi:RND family efflux transporter MFP subunit